MSLFFYRPQSRFPAGTHPVSRILALLLLFVPPLLLESPAAQALFLLFLLLPAATTGALANLWKLRIIAVTIFLVSTILWTFTLPGATILWQFGPLAVRQEALLEGLARALRLLSFLVAGVTFLTMTSLEEFAYGLRRLGVPYRVGFAVTLAFRLTPLFLEEARLIANAHRARGLELDRGGPLTRLRLFLPLLAPVMVSGFRRADGLAVALEAKGFSLPGRRTSLLHFAITWRDALLLGFPFLLNLALIFFTDP